MEKENLGSLGGKKNPIPKIPLFFRDCWDLLLGISLGQFRSFPKIPPFFLVFFWDIPEFLIPSIPFFLGLLGSP